MADVEAASGSLGDHESVDAAALVRHRTPSGLWLRAAGPLPEAHEARAVRPRPGDPRFFLLIGAPGEPLPAVDAIVDVVRDLDDDIRERMIVTVYSAESEGELSLARQLADVLGRPVRSHHGLSVVDYDGTSHPTAFDAEGQPTWRPFTELTTNHPGRSGVVVNRWHGPFRGAVALGDAGYRLTEDWLVEVMPSGLLARPTTHRPDPLLRSAPTHPDRVDLVIDLPGPALLPDHMLTALGRFADSLDSAARSRLRLVLTATVDDLSARRLQWAVPAPQVSWVPPRSVSRPVDVVVPEPVVEPVVVELVPVAEPVVAEPVVVEPVPVAEPIVVEPVVVEPVVVEPTLEPISEVVEPELEPVVEVVEPELEPVVEVVEPEPELEPVVEVVEPELEPVVVPVAVEPVEPVPVAALQPEPVVAEPVVLPEPEPVVLREPEPALSELEPAVPEPVTPISLVPEQTSKPAPLLLPVVVIPEPEPEPEPEPLVLVSTVPEPEPSCSPARLATILVVTAEGRLRLH